jgi:hypothetical protein
VEGIVLSVTSLSRHVFVACSAAALLLGSVPSVAQAAAGRDAIQHELAAQWTAQPGYTLSVVTPGLSLPTSLAAVEEPAAGGDAPVLFITELRGKVRTLTRGGGLVEFASVSTFTPSHDWPDDEGEAGMAGICLDPKRGYVFVTYAYRDKDGIMRNGISRFSADPGTFAGAARAPLDLRPILSRAPSAFSHQIGTCQVHEDLLYVSIGDAGTPTASASKASPTGKVLRMTLEGEPAPGNPFFDDADPIARRIFALGLRNPFGLAFLGDHLFGAENGIAVDRFLEISPAADYRWDGTDASIAMNALAVFTPTIGPVQTIHTKAGAPELAPSEYDRFLIAASDSTQGPGVVEVLYDASRGQVAKSPRYLVKYEGKEQGQGVCGVAETQGAIYFAPILPVAGQGVVLSARYDPSAPQALALGSVQRGKDSIAASGCLACHSRGGVGGQVGPVLDSNSLTTHIQTLVLSEDYRRRVERLDALGDERAVKGRAARREVLDAKPEARVNAWIANRLLYPQFDNLDAQMPAQNLDRATADQLAGELVGGVVAAPSAVRGALHDKHFMAGGAVGSVASLLLALGATVALRRRRAAV